MNSLENWKRINDFLEVSDQGNVKSHGKLIKGEICKNGYKRINVSHKRTHFKILVHRLIAKTFIPNPENKLCVNHKDGNKLNNCVSNLEWCSYGENMKHAFKTNLRNAKGENNTQHKLTEKQVCEIRNLYEKGKHNGNNAYKLAEKYNVNPKTILDIVNRRLWKHI